MACWREASIPTASLDIVDQASTVLLLFSPKALLNYLTESNSNLQRLRFDGLALNEEYFQVMVDAPVRIDIEIDLRSCKIKSSAGDSFLACLASGRGLTTRLYECEIHTDILVNALRGSMRLKELYLKELEWSTRSEEDFEMIAGALANTRSLEVLVIHGVSINDTAWFALCRALVSNPNLRRLRLTNSFSVRNESLSYQNLRNRSHALATLVWSHTVMQVVLVEPNGEDHDRHVFEALVVPRLEMNRTFFADQRIALKQAHIAVRPQLLGRVLAMVRLNPNLFFKLISENVDVVAATLGGNAPQALDRTMQWCTPQRSSYPTVAI